MGKFTLCRIQKSIPCRESILKQIVYSNKLKFVDATKNCRIYNAFLRIKVIYLDTRTLMEKYTATVNQFFSELVEMIKNNY